MSGFRINQNQIGETAAIVYQVAEEAVEQENPLGFSIRHYEDPHINLGRGLEELDNVPSELQRRRPGGGGYVEHDKTFCTGIAIPKDHPKEGLEEARNELGKDLEALIEEKSSLDPNYHPLDGDIYDPEGRQILGVGAADIAESFGNATLVRGCMYPEVPSSGLYQHVSASENIAPIKDGDEFHSIKQSLERGFEEVEASDFVSDENIGRAKRLQQEEGFRPAEPCFSKQTS